MLLCTPYVLSSFCVFGGNMKNKLKQFNNNSIDAISFLAQYYGIVNNDLKLGNVTHQNLSSLFPFLKKVSFEWALKNQELIYTGKLVIVKDCNNNPAPYLVQDEYRNSNKSVVLDNREFLICELVSAIEKIQSSSQNSLIILNNQEESINNYLIGNSIVDSNITSDTIYSINNLGGILIDGINSISTFDYVITNIKELSFACYSSNYSNSIKLSRVTDIIIITVTDFIRITYNGVVSKEMTLLEVRNFLIKMFNPKEEVIEEEESFDIEYDDLRDYELEKLLKKYYKGKNYEEYFKVKKELRRRHRMKKKEKQKVKRRGEVSYDEY